jgi:palmitoyl-protein thioesterase
MDDHDIHTFIGLAGPQAGEYGIPDFTDNKLMQELAAVGKEQVFSLVFLGLQADLFQKQLSVANYWNDPRESYIFAKPHSDYEVGNTFLPVLNNDPRRGTQGPGQSKSEDEAARYKANFLRVQHAVFTAGTTDETIKPWQSGVWGFYDASEKVVDLKDSQMWAEDWLGLRSLDQEGRLTLTVADGVCHTCWAHDKTVFQQHVAQHLPSRPSSVTV